jgi:hypothetical protein
MTRCSHTNALINREIAIAVYERSKHLGCTQDIKRTSEDVQKATQEVMKEELKGG